MGIIWISEYRINLVGDHEVEELDWSKLKIAVNIFHDDVCLNEFYYAKPKSLPIMVWCPCDKCMERTCEK